MYCKDKFSETHMVSFKEINGCVVLISAEIFLWCFIYDNFRLGKLCEEMSSPMFEISDSLLGCHLHSWAAVV